ncbi:MAG: bifunctional 4-hydroxy-3-methylbut-2-enyl diphosphate reductase/30S ribosomal protein S1 [Oscillospiraceae bacterium]|jgi:4-hydroxy-3-methylbut-2-enyl diphosphate reductase|nr:bifunctional 4-hydroxy-3-methylbut-2-enyl diphosphate reductase/30S ribosomal protein S1 [Oscillospiraceae bacterium]
MRVITAKTAGFCYGVKRAVELCIKAAEDSERCVTLGPIIHNNSVIADLAARGVRVIDDVTQAREGDTVVLRSHGVGEEEYKSLEERKIRIVDATCPSVAKIHKIVRRAERDGRLPIVIGEREHPEVRAIEGWCGESECFETAEQLSDWLEKVPDCKDKPLTLVFQTTLGKRVFDKCSEIAKKLCTNAEIFDTICDTTNSRQREAECLAKLADAMIVVGAPHSGNSRRLADICRKHCGRVYFIETAAELEDNFASQFKPTDVVGITAGASAPSWIIKEVKQKMMEESRDEVFTEQATPIADATDDAVIVAPAADDAEPVEETVESFEEMLEKSIKTLHTGEKVIGVVAAITPTEISVDLGIKQSGYIPISELTDDPNAKIEDIVKVGQEIETFVTRVNDVEGTVMLSRKRLDAIKSWSDIEVAKDNRTVVEGVVTEENKGGVVVTVRGVRVFVPASRTGLAREAAMTELLKKKVKLVITEVNQSRRRVVGSIGAASNDEKREKSEKIWNEIEVGKKYDGTVKSLTSYGAFVDIGGIDGMVHVSELSWTHIKHPSDVLAAGDKVPVYVLGFDKEKKKISLGYKDPSGNPWSRFTEGHNVGDIVNVKIVKLMAFGAFAEIIPGVDGLIHISQLADRRVNVPSEVVREGQNVDVKITAIDNEKQKVSLSIRAVVAPESMPLTDSEVEEARNEERGSVVVYDTDTPTDFNED